jgi:hypothetical protein
VRICVCLCVADDGQIALNALDVFIGDVDLCIPIDEVSDHIERVGSKPKEINDCKSQVRIVSAILRSIAGATRDVNAPPTTVPSSSSSSSTSTSNADNATKSTSSTNANVHHAPSSSSSGNRSRRLCRVLCPHIFTTVRSLAGGVTLQRMHLRFFVKHAVAVVAMTTTTTNPETTTTTPTATTSDVVRVLRCESQSVSPSKICVKQTQSIVRFALTALLRRVR